MKKPRLLLLFSVTCLLAAFTLGIFIGRNAFQGRVQISVTETSAPVYAVARQDSAPSSPVNINTAGVYELASLPGIGEVLAQRIVDHRTQFGPFSAPEELLRVSGIGTAKLEAILDYITAGG